MFPVILDILDIWFSALLCDPGNIEVWSLYLCDSEILEIGLEQFSAILDIMKNSLLSRRRMTCFGNNVPGKVALHLKTITMNWFSRYGSAGQATMFSRLGPRFCLAWWYQPQIWGMRYLWSEIKFFRKICNCSSVARMSTWISTWRRRRRTDKSSSWLPGP